jgi:hypothetical protein
LDCLHDEGSYSTEVHFMSARVATPGLLRNPLARIKRNLGSNAGWRRLSVCAFPKIQGPCLPLSSNRNWKMGLKSCRICMLSTCARPGLSACPVHPHHWFFWKSKDAKGPPDVSWTRCLFTVVTCGPAYFGPRPPQPMQHEYVL